MKTLGRMFIGLGIVDFCASLMGIDFYAFFGIHLTGFAYEYSPIAAGVLGLVLIQLDTERDADDAIKDLLEADEQLILCQGVSVKRGGLFDGFEQGKLFLTNTRVGFVGVSVTQGDSVDFDAAGGGNFSWDLNDISSVKGSFASVEILSNGETFKFQPGLHKVKDVVAAIQSNLH